jgi:hypothetical protein
MGKRIQYRTITPTHQRGARYKFQFQGSGALDLKQRVKESSMMALAASVNTGEMSRRSRLFTMNLSLSLIPYQNCSGINLCQTKRNGIP